MITVRGGTISGYQTAREKRALDRSLIFVARRGKPPAEGSKLTSKEKKRRKDEKCRYRRKQVSKSTPLDVASEASAREPALYSVSMRAIVGLSKSLYYHNYNSIRTEDFVQTPKNSFLVPSCYVFICLFSTFFFLFLSFVRMYHVSNNIY